MNAVSEIELVNIFIAVKKSLGTDHYYIYRGVTIFGTCRQFFPKNDVFPTIFSLHFAMKTISFTTVLKNVTSSFIDLI